MQCRHSPQTACLGRVMNHANGQPQPDEAALVKLYMDLMGSSETQARSVYMYKFPDNGSTVLRDGFAQNEPLVVEQTETQLEPQNDSDASFRLNRIAELMGLTPATTSI